MACITTCLKCGKGYEECSEEEANSPDRMCPACWQSTSVDEARNRIIKALSDLARRTHSRITPTTLATIAQSAVKCVVNQCPKKDEGQHASM